MPRIVASLLLALVGAMALLPQAMCPCAVNGRAEAMRAARGPAPAKATCCERCHPRRSAASVPCAPTSGECPADRGSCPCCEVNGAGKYLVPLGQVVRVEVAPAAPEFLSLTVVLAPLLAQAGPEVAPVARSTVDPPPHDLRAGVVLLI